MAKPASDSISDGTFTSEAIDLLDCFCEGIDEMVAEIGSDVARKRGSNVTSAEDIRSAVQHLAYVIGHSDLPDAAKSSFTKMMTRFTRLKR